jgi:hypothetical protein
VLFEVAKVELVVRTGISDSGLGSNLKEKGRTTVWLGMGVVVLDLMRLCRLDPCEYLGEFGLQSLAQGCGLELFAVVSRPVLLMR